MDRTRVRYAAKQGATIAAAVFAIGYGLAALRPSEPPRWPLVVTGPLIVGTVYAILVVTEAGPFDPPV